VQQEFIFHNLLLYINLIPSDIFIYL